MQVNQKYDFINLKGHWIHADNPEQTLNYIGNFLEKIDS